MKQNTYRFRRLAAILIDWNLAALPTIILTILLMPLFKKGLHPLVFVPIWAAFPVLFLNRDRLFKGGSPGNRLMKLIVLDRRTLQPLTGKALLTRNLFMFLGGVDLLVLLITGTTLGDRAVAALVVPRDQIPDTPPQRTRATKKSLMKTALIAALCLLLFAGFIRLSLNSVKDEPHYAVAYRYLLESEAFAQLEAQERDIQFTGFSRNTRTVNGVTETEAAFTFQVKGKQLIVVCHPRGEDWYVCGECTFFR